MEEIGYGNNATIFKKKIKSNYFAVRQQKVHKSEALEYEKHFTNDDILENTDTNHKMNRFIYFNKFINTINKHHFLTLYKYEIDKCNFKQKILPWAENNEYFINKNKEYIKSKVCVSLIHDLKEGNVQFIYNAFKNDKKCVYSMLIQILYALHLMHSNGYYHTDINNDDVAYIKTNIKTLNIFNLQIPTYGYIYSIIGYSSVLSNKFKLSKWEIQRIITEQLHIKDNLSLIYHIIFDANCPDNTFLQDILINMRYNPDNKVSDDIKLKFNNYLLNYEDAIFFIKNADNTKKLINYFYTKINNNL
jgi:hypothetical protein